jgi:hypothetical protein
MAKWVTSAVLDDGLNSIKTNAIRMLLIDNYTLGDSYATVVGNIVASVVMASGDYTLAGTAGNPRTLTTASGKSATASATTTGGDNLHFAFTNNVDTVYWVTDETSNQVVTSGNTVNFPQLVYTSNQPT